MVHYYSFRQKRVLSSHYGSGCVHWCISHRVVLPYTVLHECLGQLYVARGTRDVDDSLHGAWLRVSDDYVT
jgi:hypothetical protein